MSKKIDQWLPLYVADYKADTSRLTTEQHGAYLLIIMDYWRNGPPPDDDAVLAQITGLPLDRWKKHRPIIERFFAVDDGAWTQKRIELELLKAKRVNDQKSEAGKASAAKRWGNEDYNGDGNEKVTGVTTDDVTESVTARPRQNAPSQSPTPLTLKALPTPSLPTPKSRSKDLVRASRLPADWILPKAWGEWALQERPELTAERVRNIADTFKDHWIAQPGQKGVKADWQATWRNWVRREKGMNGGVIVAAPRKKAEPPLPKLSEAEIKNNQVRVNELVKKFKGKSLGGAPA